MNGFRPTRDYAQRPYVAIVVVWLFIVVMCGTAGTVSAQTSTLDMSGINTVVLVDPYFNYAPIIAAAHARGAKVIRLGLLDLSLQDNNHNKGLNPGDTGFDGGFAPYNQDWDPLISYPKYRRAYYQHVDSSWGGINAMLDRVQNDILPLAAHYHMRVVIGLMYSPGEYVEKIGIDPSTMKPIMRINDSLLERSDYRGLFLEVWTRVVKALGGNRTICAWDLQNEPRHMNEAYRSRIQDTISTIRSLGARQPIIVESPAFFSAANARLVGQLMDLGLRDRHQPLIYSFHFYVTEPFTQWNGNGIEPQYNTFIQHEMTEVVKRVADFQRQHGNPPVWVGEFGASCWHQASAGAWAAHATNLLRSANIGGAYIGTVFTNTPTFIWDIIPSVEVPLRKYWR